MVIDRQITISIRSIGHVLTAIFVPISCSLSVKVLEKTYYFDPDLSESGCKFSLYLPLFCCSETFTVSIEVSPKFEGKTIPLTFFYLNLKPQAGRDLHDDIVVHLENTLLLKKGNPDRLTFVTGRINTERYSPYIVNNQIRAVTLGSFELVTLYTRKKEELSRLLASDLKVFTILE